MTARTVALGGLGAFVALVAVQHPLRDDLPPADHFISEYAKGSTAAVQVIAFLCWAVAMAATAACARTHAGRPWARGIVTAALCLSAAGCVVAALFATQTIAGELPPGTQRTTAGRLHDLGTLLILAGLLVAAFASLRLVRDRRYRWTVAGLGAALLAVVPVLVALGLDAPGIGQRALIAIGCLFLWRLAAV